MVGRWVRAHKPLVGSVATAALAIVTTIVVAFVLITSSLEKETKAKNEETKAKNNANALAGDLSVSLTNTERERRNAFDSLSNLYRERGLTLCKEGDAGRGLLWIARALQY